MKQITVSAMEYAALLTLDQNIRIAMHNPEAAEFLVLSIQALDQVRLDEGIAAPEKIASFEDNKPKLSPIAKALIDRVSR
jgi:nitrogen-specific signal transduction histidine kinase